MNLAASSYFSKIQKFAVGIVFFLTAIFWILRKFINNYFNININDTSIGLFGALLLFIIPIKKR